MAIAFVNGAVNAAASAQTVSVTYSPTPGNIVIVFLDFSNTVSALTVQDSALNTLTAGPAINTGVPSTASFYYTAASGITGFTANWTTNRLSSIVVVEYSGANGINATLAGNTSTGNSTTPSITVTTEDPNDFIVAALADSSNTININVGNNRKAEGAGSTRMTAGDNTSASAGTVTVAGTMTSGVWNALAIELRLVVSLITPPAITAEYHWGGGDGW